MDHVAGHGAHHRTAQRTTPVRAHDDLVAVVGLRIVDDHLGRVADADVVITADTSRAEHATRFLVDATPGTAIYISDTAGEYSETAGTKSYIIGYAETAEILWVNPQPVALA